MKIVFATGNPDKLREIKEIAEGTDIEFILPPGDFNPAENGKTFEENSYIKALEASRVSNMMSLADDSGLCVEALNGAPGIHSARYAQTAQKRIDKLLDELKDKQNRKAKFVCAMTLVSSDGKILYQTIGECHGKIREKRSGEGGFGYDPIFEVENTNLTMAEMREEEKNKVSHRGRALRDVLKFLEKLD